jgi:hypothetical protein
MPFHLSFPRPLRPTWFGAADIALGHDDVGQPVAIESIFDGLRLNDPWLAQLNASEARTIKTENLFRQLLAARSECRSEQSTEGQLALFEAELKAESVNVEALSKGTDSGNNPDNKDPPASTGGSAEAGSRGRRALPIGRPRQVVTRTKQANEDAGSGAFHQTQT